MELVRAYLLGKLDDDASASLEDRYFTERACFLRIQEIETGLIADYLDGRLPAADHRLFEGKYLSVPELRKKVEEVRASRVVPPLVRSTTRSFVWRPAFALGLALTLGVFGWYLTQHRTPVANLSVTPVIALHLTPGFTKSGDLPESLTLPANDVRVDLILDLPARQDSIECAVRLVLPGDGGAASGKSIDLGRFRSAPNAAGQHLTVPMSTRGIVAADYLVEVTGPGERRLATYTFRVNR
jgi:hypothetical protein